VVRGASALLAAAAVALAYALVAGTLPDIGDGNGAVIVAGGVGLLAVSAVTLAAVGIGETLTAAVLLAVGGGLVAGALDDAGIDAAAIVPEAIFAGAAGVLLARGLLAYAGPAVALAVPLFVALVDIGSVVAGPTSRLANGNPRGASVLAFDLASWGGALDGPAARLGLPDAIFLAAFATWALRLDLRPRLTIVTMICGLMATLVISVTADRTIPALPLLAAGFLLPNLDRLGALLREARRA
jgi:hypothetical protein